MAKNFFERTFYKDLMDVYKEDTERVGNVNKTTEKLVYSKIICKMYRIQEANLQMPQGGGEIQENNSIAYPLKYKLKAGMILRVWQYGIGYGNDEYEKYIIGKPKPYKEPFGGVKAGLEHNQASIELKKRV